MRIAVIRTKCLNNIFLFFLSAVNTVTGVVDAYQHMAPMVDTVMYMQWLYKQCKNKGCRFVHDEIKGLLRDQAEELKRKYKAQLIFNCSGLNAKELAGDEDVYPLRGTTNSFTFPLMSHNCITLLQCHTLLKEVHL